MKIYHHNDLGGRCAAAIVELYFSRQNEEPSVEARARARNWNKAQVKCIEATAKRMLSGKEMYPLERVALDMILLQCRFMLRNWEPKPPTLKEEI